jgi:hypothetical protein
MGMAKQVSHEFNLDQRNVLSNIRLDYVWVDPRTGEMHCWLNNLPNPWSPAGTNGDIIASGAGPSAQVYIAVNIASFTQEVSY